MRDLLKLSEIEFDTLKEIGNIGAGHVATAISLILEKDVDINIPDIRFISIDEFADYLGGPGRMVSTIYIRVTGDLSGEAMFVFPVEGCLELVDLLLKRPVGTTKSIDESELSTSSFSEMSSILTGSFLNAMSKMLDVVIRPSVPHIATDMVQSVIDMLLIKIGTYADSALSVGTNINVMGHNIDGKFVILFDKESLFRMLDRIHEKYGSQEKG